MPVILTPPGMFDSRYTMFNRFAFVQTKGKSLGSFGFGYAPRKSMVYNSWFSSCGDQRFRFPWDWPKTDHETRATVKAQGLISWTLPRLPAGHCTGFLEQPQQLAGTNITEIIWTPWKRNVQINSPRTQNIYSQTWLNDLDPQKENHGNPWNLRRWAGKRAEGGKRGGVRRSNGMVETHRKEEASYLTSKFCHFAPPPPQRGREENGAKWQSFVKAIKSPPKRSFQLGSRKLESLVYFEGA